MKTMLGNWNYIISVIAEDEKIFLIKKNMHASEIGLGRKHLFSRVGLRLNICERIFPSAV